MLIEPGGLRGPLEPWEESLLLPPFPAWGRPCLFLGLCSCSGLEGFLSPSGRRGHPSSCLFLSYLFLRFWYFRSKFRWILKLEVLLTLFHHLFSIDNTVYQAFSSTPSLTPDDDVFQHLATTYAQNHPSMHLGLPCKPGSPSFLNGTTNGAGWYPVTGGAQVNFPVFLTVRFWFSY